MNVTRRRFLTNSTMSAAALPLLSGLHVDYCEAGIVDDIDWNMRYPQGAMRMGLNENPLGPSPLAVEAAKRGMDICNRYPEPKTLREVLAEHHGIEEDWVLVSNGSGELLKLIPLVYSRQTGENVISPREAYRKTPRYAGKLGATPRYINLRADDNYTYDIAAMLDAVDNNTRIFYVVNPNNPTGSILSYDELKSIADALPEHVMFVIDEAYAQYTPKLRTGIDLLKEGYRNVIITRTFSKAYALAALRCGYGVGHPDSMKKIIQFGASYDTLNIAAYGAVQATLHDHEHLERSRRFASEVLSYYKTQCEKLSLAYISGPVDLPYILIETGPNTNAIQKELENRLIYVRTGQG
jgi:histidinol-phosphate aminotransferase